jgi:hypothetical protein
MLSSTLANPAQKPVRERLKFLGAYAFGAAAAAFTFTAGLFSRRHRGLIMEIGRHFGYRRVSPHLPHMSVDDLVPDGDPLTILAPHGTDGNVTPLELIVLTRLVRSQAPRRIFEFGTFDGRTTLNLAANAPADARVTTLDLPPEQAGTVALPLDPTDRSYIGQRPSGARFQGSPWASRIEALFGDSATIDLERYRGAIDLVFIDASHSYDYVLSDSQRALGLLRNGRGTIVWHDYDGVWPGVTRALNDLHDRGGVFADLRRVSGTTLAVLTVRP